MEEAPRTPRKRPEMDLQVACFQLFKLYPHLVAWAVQNEKGALSKDPAKAARYGAARKRSGVLPGAPDIAVNLPGGRTIYLELKAPKGRVSEAQEDVHARLRALGHSVYVVRSVEEVQQLLARHNAFQHRPVQPLHPLAQAVPL